MKKIDFLTKIMLGFIFIFYASYSQAQPIELVYWTGENTSTYTYPQAGTGLASSISAASQNYWGLATYADNRNVWTNPSALAAVDPNTSPYLSFTLTIPGGSMNFDRFVIAGAAPTTPGIKMQLRWSVDAYASSVGEFTPGGSSYNLTSVDLSGTAKVTTTTVEFRVYYYAVSGNVFHSDTGPYTSLDGTPASYSPFGRCFGIWATPCTSTATIDTANCGSYVSPSGKYTWTTTGTYYDTIPNSEMCDSLLTINFTNNSNTGSETVTECDSYEWSANGTTYTTSGTYMATLQNAAGCDSVVTLNLTINNSNTGSETVTECNSYEWSANGTTYTTSGTYMATLQNAAGCDSVVTLNLTINNSNTGSETVTECDSYEWSANGTTYTTSGTYMATLQNAAGCDSVVTLNLTINSSNTGSETITACDSYEWSTNGTTYTSGGTYTATLQNAAGCDSVVTLNLTINSSTTGTETVTACDSYTWSNTGTKYTTSGDYTDTLTNAAGCDSVVTLKLTIVKVDTTVTQASKVLTAKVMGAAYQWLDCSNSYAKISGATNQSFTATAKGNYAVQITVDNCIDTSSCYTVSTTYIRENVTGPTLSVYPNPTNGNLNILMRQMYDEIQVLVRNISGQIVSTHEFYHSKQFNLEMVGTKGLYLVEIIPNTGESAFIKVFKE